MNSRFLLLFCGLLVACEKKTAPKEQNLEIVQMVQTAMGITFDCDDDGCAGSPDCSDSDTETPTNLTIVITLTIQIQPIPMTQMIQTTPMIRLKVPVGQVSGSRHES